MNDESIPSNKHAPEAPTFDQELDELRSGIAQLEVTLSDHQCRQLITYATKVAAANEQFNLTRIPRHAYVKLHLLDSLAALPVILRWQNDAQLHGTDADCNLLDVGTGAGFPGVPLACALPQCHVTLLDSTAKKVNFAASAAHESGINNCVPIHNRAEFLARDGAFRQSFDIVVSRAVASMDKLLDLMLPLTKPGGIAIALKGAAYNDELEAARQQLKKHRATSVEVVDVMIPGTDVMRHLIVVQGRTR